MTRWWWRFRPRTSARRGTIESGRGGGARGVSANRGVRQQDGCSTHLIVRAHHARQVEQRKPVGAGGASAQTPPDCAKPLHWTLRPTHQIVVAKCISVARLPLRDELGRFVSSGSNGALGGRVICSVVAAQLRREQHNLQAGEEGGGGGGAREGERTSGGRPRPSHSPPKCRRGSHIRPAAPAPT